LNNLNLNKKLPFPHGAIAPFFILTYDIEDMNLTIKVQTKAKKNLVSKISENQFKIQTTAVPEKGLANKKIIDLLSEYLKIPKTKLKIISGLTSKNKKIEVN